MTLPIHSLYQIFWKLIDAILGELLQSTGDHTSQRHTCMKNRYYVLLKCLWGKTIYNILYYITSISILSLFKHYQNEQRGYIFESQRLRDHQKQHLAYYHASDVRIHLITVPYWVLRNWPIQTKGVIILLNRYGLVIWTG